MQSCAECDYHTSSVEVDRLGAITRHLCWRESGEPVTRRLTADTTDTPPACECLERTKPLGFNAEVTD